MIEQYKADDSSVVKVYINAYGVFSTLNCTTTSYPTTTPVSIIHYSTLVALVAVEIWLQL